MGNVAYAWGDNEYGQLGINAITNKSVPTSVSSAISWITIEAEASKHAVGIYLALSLPVVTTESVSNVWWGNMVGNATITNIEGNGVTAKGFVYKEGVAGDPVLTDSVVSTTGNVTGAFSLGIPSLTPITGYRVRGYAASIDGTGYGSTVQATTLARATASAPRITEIDFMEYPTDVLAAAAYVSDGAANLIVTSSSGTKSEGSYALKVVALIAASLNKKLTRTLTGSDNIVNLTDCLALSFDIYSSLTGSNIKIGIQDSGGTITEITPSIASAGVWQTVTWDISAISNANKNEINKIIVTMINADAENTFYIDNFKVVESAVTGSVVIVIED